MRSYMLIHFMARDKMANATRLVSIFSMMLLRIFSMLVLIILLLLNPAVLDYLVLLLLDYLVAIAAHTGRQTGRLTD